MSAYGDQVAADRKAAAARVNPKPKKKKAAAKK